MYIVFAQTYMNISKEIMLNVSVQNQQSCKAKPKQLVNEKRRPSERPGSGLRERT